LVIGSVICLTDNEREAYRTIIKSHKHKAQLLRQIHSDQYSKYQSRSNLLNAGSIILATLITIMSVANISNFLNFLNFYFKIKIDINFVSIVLSGAITLSAFMVLFISLTDLILGWRNKYLTHESGVRLLTGFITTTNEIETLIENDSIADEQAKIRIEEMKKRYELIGEMLPLTPDQDFLDSKQKYLIKRELSEKLDRDPCIKIDLKNYIKNCRKKL
jgi:hypothetical protein